MPPSLLSAEPAANTSKRKSARSVSALTPSQLARKRANDREAQRAIRARTKDRIERLERELDELRSRQSRDRMVQDLLRRNTALEDEISCLKEVTGTVSTNSSPYPGPVGTTILATGLDTESHHNHKHYHADLLAQSLAGLTRTPAVLNDNLSIMSTGGPPIPRPHMSPLPSAADHVSMTELGQQHNQHQPQNWQQGMLPSVSCPSPPITDEYGASTAYIHASVPASMTPPDKDVKLEFGNMQSLEKGYIRREHLHQLQQRNAAWTVYPACYHGAQQAVGVSR